jgi:hypothetical protein
MPDYRVKRPASPDDFIGEAVEQISAAYAEAADTKRAQNVMEAATPGQRLLCAWYFYWDDVTNGGHAQYFSNYTGDLWHHALKAGETFGVPEAAMLKEAVALFPKGQPGPTSRERRKQLAKIDSDKLDELDERFNNAPASDQEVRRYIEAHVKDFISDAGA